MPHEQPDPLLLPIVAGTVILLLVAGMGIFAWICCAKERHDRRELQARLNEDYSIRSKIIFSHQKRSEQPVVIINSRTISLFKFFTNHRERAKWKRWVQKSYTKLHPDEEFPVYIDGQVTL
jgi:hypothetical protein